MRVDLPDGQWVELRDRATHRETKAFVRGLMEASENAASPFDKGLAIKDATAAWMVVGWSFEAPLPSENAEALDDLDSVMADVLIEAAIAQQEVLMPSFAQSPKPASPTPPSGD